MSLYFVALRPVLVQLPILGYVFLRAYLHKHCGKRLVIGNQADHIKKQQIRMTPFMLLGGIFLVVLLDYKKYIMWEHLSKQDVFQLVSMPAGYLIGSLIGACAFLFRKKANARQIGVFGFKDSDILPIMQGIIHEYEPKASPASRYWLQHVFHMSDGKICVVGKGTTWQIEFAIKPEERAIQFRDRFMEQMRLAHSPFATTPPPSLRFSLRSLMLGVVLFGGLFGVYTSRQPWTKVKEWKAHEQTCDRVLYSPDGKLILTQSLDATRSTNEAIIWDAATREKRAVLPAGYQFNAAFSPDGKHVALGRNTVLICAVETGAVEKELPGHEANALAYSPDGKLLACGTSDAYVEIWDVTTSSPISTLPQKSGVTAIVFSSDGKDLLLGHSNGDCEQWNLANKKVTWYGTGSGSRVTSLSFDFVGLGVAIAHGDKKIEIKFASNGRYYKSIYGRSFSYETVQYSPRGFELLTNGVLPQIWRTDDTYEPTDEFPGYTNACFHPVSGDQLAMSSGRMVSIWERRNSGPWWTVVYLPIFWIALAACVGFGISFYGDLKLMKVKQDEHTS